MCDALTETEMWFLLWLVFCCVMFFLIFRGVELRAMMLKRRMERRRNELLQRNLSKNGLAWLEEREKQS